MNPLAEQDLNHILDHTCDLWQQIRGERLFITGGTGFFGCWLLESFLWANQRLNLGANAVVLSRSPEKFLERMPHLKDQPALSWVKGDVTQFDFPDGEFSFIVHAATQASAKLTREEPRKMFDSIVTGTQRVLDFALTHGTQKFLLTSSGAVYGRQPSDLLNIPEEYPGGPNPLEPLSVYAEGKRAAEMLCAVSTANTNVEAKIARCFAFVGPHLPLDAHFAIGNFIRDGMKGGPIVIQGDGTPCRSYLYASDLMIWLWTILFKGRHLRPYNVGSEASVSIAELAEAVAQQFGKAVKIELLIKATPNQLIERYVPDVSRVKAELGLTEIISLNQGIASTINYYQ